MSVDSDFYVYVDMVKELDKTFANPFEEYLLQHQDSKGWIPISDIASKISNGPILKFDVTPPHIKHALKNHFSQYVEMDSHEVFVRRKPIDLMIKQKIHYWFSDRNWCRDLYLHQLAEENQGMVPLRALVGFPSMFQSLEGEYPAKSVSFYIDVLCRVLADSDELEVIPCQEPMICRRSLGERVRRKIDRLFQDSSNGALHELESESVEGYVPLSQILTFPNIFDTVKPCVSAVAKAMQQSCVVEVSPDGLHIRKRRAVGVHIEDELSDPEVSENLPQSMGFYPSPNPSIGESVGFLSSPFTCNSPTEFSVVQFNMLAKFLCTEEYYPYCNPKFLKWNYRRRLLEEGLTRVKADIICLEEVQGSNVMEPNEFNDHAVYLRNLGARLGYGMIYCMKTKADGTQNKMSMGNALLYKKSVFDFLDLKNVPYAVELQKHCGTDANVRKRYLNEQQVAVFAKLTHKATGNIIVAAVTHITCKFSEPDIQIAQIAVLLETLDQYATYHSVLGNHGRLPVVLCGDFNMTPYSSGYEFIRTGGIISTHPDIRPNDYNVMPFLVGHPLLDGSRRLLSFSSAYVRVCTNDPETTNVKPPFSGCLDYIWCHGLEPYEVLPIGKISELSREGGGLPNSKIPSDHVPIGAKFRFVVGI